jgi:predicted RNase H-like nuclease (RuvC/YqgF family)
MTDNPIDNAEDEQQFLSSVPDIINQAKDGTRGLARFIKQLQQQVTKLECQNTLLKAVLKSRDETIEKLKAELEVSKEQKANNVSRSQAEMIQSAARFSAAVEAMLVQLEIINNHARSGTSSNAWRTSIKTELEKMKVVVTKTVNPLQSVATH